jgi:ParB family transcriptional regulator, chromosome partitioning protein
MAVLKKSLGRGIDALMMSSAIDEVDESRIERIEMDKLAPNPDQPRKTFNEDGLESLASSIREHGIVQPIIVRKKKDRYMIIAGERRYRASIMAGLQQMPCVVVDYDDATVAKIALVENVQREDLNIIEEAHGYDKLMSAYGLTQEQVSVSVGKSRSHVANTIRLLKLEDTVITLVSEGKITGGHARALLRIPSPHRQLELALHIIEHDMSVREIESLVAREIDRDQAAEKEKRKAGDKAKSPETKQFQTKLEDALTTKVIIKEGKKSGRIEIEYYGNDDLERILGIITRESLK